jgi:hypothetical protein
LFFSAFSFFMWVRHFTARHKNANEGVCFLAMQRFSTLDAVWDSCFLPHAVHGAMQKPARCECGSACGLNFSPQESINRLSQSHPLTLKTVAILSFILSACQETLTNFQQFSS